MKKNIILLLVLVLLAGMAYVGFLSDKKSTLASKPLSDFAIEDTASVSRIFISDKVTGSVDLTRDPDKGWMVNGKYRAKNHAVDLLMEAFKNIKIRGPVAENLRPRIISNAASSGKKIEIYTSDSSTPEKVWISAGNTSDHHGDYFILEIPGLGLSPEPFIVDMPMFAGYLTARFYTFENDWRYSGVFEYPDLDFKEVRVRQKDKPEQSFTIKWNGESDINVIKPLTGEVIDPLDSLIAKDYLLRYKKIHLETHNNYLEPHQIDSVFSQEPHWDITVVENSGQEKNVKLYHLPGEGRYQDFDGNDYAYNQDVMFGTMDGKELFKAQYGAVFKPLLVDASYFSSAVSGD